MFAPADHAWAVQPTLHLLTTPNPETNAHFSIPSFGDVDGDGRADIAVGAASETVGGNAQQGRAYVFSGASGALLWTFTTPNPQPDAFFGYRVFANADVNGDLRADVVVGAPFENVGANDDQGRVYVFSGANGALLHSLNTPDAQTFANFGVAIAAGDMNADGKAEVVVGAPGTSVLANSGQGRVYVFSGATGGHLQTLNSQNPQANGAFGNSVATGQVDLGTQSDIAVGASQETVLGNVEQGRVYVFAGGTWMHLHTLASPQAQSFAGCCSVALGDVNSDGRDDVAMGSIHEDVSGNVGQGRVYVFSGLNGAILHTLTTPNPEPGLPFGFGTFISMGPILTAGRDDIAVSAQFETVSGAALAGRTHVFSGQTGGLLYSLHAPTLSNSPLFGYVPIGELRDIDADGHADLAVGAFNETVSSNIGQGRVRVFSGLPLSVGGSIAEPDVSPLQEPARSARRRIVIWGVIAIAVTIGSAALLSVSPRSLRR